MISIRKVYLFLGSAWTDVSDLVSYKDLVITHRACSDTYHRAQDVASFTLSYDATIFAQIYAATDDIQIKITQEFTDSLYPSLSLYPSTSLFPRDSSVATTLFTGIIPPTASRKYNGILNNTVLRLEAVDYSKYLNKKIGDYYLADCTIMDPFNKATSIVHQLAYLAGLTDSDIDQTITINIPFEHFAPNNPNDTILSVLDVLLFEYGYVLNFDANGDISPVLWIQSGASIHTFNEDTIAREIEIEEQEQEYDAVDLTYYELAEREHVRVYTESLPYNEDGSFAGYPIPPGYYFPIEANVIDRITGDNKTIYQQYQDTAIKYFTNEAIAKGLDYNYKAFDSDFSGIVATSNHVLETESLGGLVTTISSFGSKKAQVLYQNTTSGYQSLYYSNIYATVVYKSSARILRAGLASDSAIADNYQSQFIFNETSADNLAKNMVQMYGAGNTYYKFVSETDVPVGAFTTVITNDAVNQLCFVLEKTYEEATGLFSYKLKGYSYNQGVLISEENSNVSDISDAFTRASSTEYSFASATVASSEIIGPFKYKCDGIDDNVQIQEAIDYVYNTYGGGDVYLTAGTFKNTGPIELYSGINIKGVGTGATIIERDGAFRGIGAFGTVDIPVHDFGIYDITVLEKPGNPQAYSLLQVRYGNNFLISNCNIYNGMVNGIAIAYSNNGGIENCTISGCSNSGTSGGIALVLNNNVTVSKCTLSHNGICGIAVQGVQSSSIIDSFITYNGGGILFAGFQSLKQLNVSRNTIQNNNGEGIGRLGVTSTLYKSTISENNISYNGSYYGINLAIAESTINGNLIYYNNSFGIYAVGDENIFSANNIRECLNGIFVSGDNNSISSNSIITGNENGINVAYGSLNTLIVGNRVTGFVLGNFVDAGTNTVWSGLNSFV